MKPKHTVSSCCSAPCKYRQGTVVKTGKEIMVAFCCECETQCKTVQKTLTAAQIKKNKGILLRSIFPGIGL